MNPVIIDKEILDLCIRVNGTRAFYPLYNRVSESVLEPTQDMIGNYGWNNGKIAFVTPSGDYYVTPYCVEVADYLNKHGYQNGYIYVPFSNDDEPSDPAQAMKWKRLCVTARQLHNEKEKERRKENIKSIAESKNLKRLPSSAYDLCLLIPEEGLETKSFYDDSVERPVHELELRDNMGTYCQNNGRVAFVDGKGDTYVTPYCHEIKKYLKDAGYKESHLEVPLSNGEEIIDPTYKEQWENLCLAERAATKSRIAEEKKERIKEMAALKGITPLPNDLYRLTFEIPEAGVETVWFGEQRDKTLPVDDFNLETNIGTYCQNNGRVVFVNDQGRTFVTPFCSEVRNYLQNVGYKEGSIFVPFSNGEIPAEPLLKIRWKQLCALSKKEYEKREERRKIERLNDLARGKNIKELPVEVYEMSLKIPKDGFDVLFYETERDRVRPVLDFELDRSLGTYYQNNGRVVFVDCNGDTYVTPHCEDVVKHLNEAGYSVGHLYVPLSNGEKIVDQDIAAKWNNLCARITE